MAWPSSSSRSKTWGTEILTSTDLHSQLDLLHSYFNDSLNGTTGHDHSGGTSEGPKITLTAAAGVTGVLPIANGGTALSALGAAYQVLRTNSGATAAEYAGVISVVTTTKNIADASTTQTVTGAGMTPRYAVILAAVDNTSAFSVGSDLSTSAHYSLWDQVGAGTGSNWGVSSTSSIILQTTSGNNHVGSFTTFNSDGGVITWTKTGSPTGTARLIIIFLA